MRLNQFIAHASGLSRRAADTAIAAGRVTVNDQTAVTGQAVADTDSVELDGQRLQAVAARTIMLNKPVGYVCSRDGQGRPTIYDLLPPDLHHLKPIGRLDKDSSGLLLLTSDGQLANQLSHPRYGKDKIYQVVLDKPLSPVDRHQLEQGVELADGRSQLRLQGSGTAWTVTMRQGRNRQIRRTFGRLGYTVKQLHRTQLGHNQLKDLASGKFEEIIVK